MPKKKISVTDDFWNDYRSGLYTITRAWAIKGENLLHAADAVQEASLEADMRFNLRDQALMLIGMSIEAMLKAIILKDKDKCELVSEVRQPTTRPDEKLLKIFYDHDLVELALEAGLSLSKDETKVAKGLSTYVRWRGRYVAPKKKGVKDVRPIRHDDGLFGPPDIHLTYERTKELVAHVVAEVQLRLYDKISTG